MKNSLFSLTSQERKALAVVAFLFLLGVGVRHYAARMPAAYKKIFFAGGDEESFSVDINRAGLNELMKMPGIGRRTAERIINYRTEKGSFRSKEDLLNIKGIGPKKLKAISRFIKIK